MDWLKIALGILCVWRITHLLNAEDGPGHSVVRLRQAAGTTVLGQMLSCFYCLSVYVAAPLTLPLSDRWDERLLLWPALSAAAILLERLTGERQLNLQDLYAQDPVQGQQENSHVLP
jgi:hypothetical protein